MIPSLQESSPRDQLSILIDNLEVLSEIDERKVDVCQPSDFEILGVDFVAFPFFDVEEFVVADSALVFGYVGIF